MSQIVCNSIGFSTENESSLEIPGVTLALVIDDVTLAVTLYALVLRLTVLLRSPGGVVEDAVMMTSGGTPVVTSLTNPVIPSAVVAGRHCRDTVDS